MGGIFVFSKVVKPFDAKEIENYGERIEVMGDNMNVLIEGEGKETIVMITGYGTSAPALDFAPMIDALSPYYRVVVLEPFGYGLSDGTERPRTKENIVEEMHVALETLAIDSFIYMAQSIGGLYGLTYANTYPGEMKAFIGIETSLPEQPEAELPTGFLKFLRESGIMRASFLFNGQNPLKYKNPQEKVDQMTYIMIQNGLSDTLLDELDQMPYNFQSSRGVKFPKNLPVYLFVQENNTGVDFGLEMHEAQIEGLTNARLMPLDGDHYLHYTEAEVMAEETRAFLAEYGM